MEYSKILSISVASYNLGNMVKQNIESFCQSDVLDDIELIVTDDGSKDNTADIVEGYVNRYPTSIKLIRKGNEGPGSTVNSGILHATGKYFRMVDGDDWVNTANFEKFVNFLKQVDADMIVSNYDIFDNSCGKVIETTEFNILKKKILNFTECYNKLPKEMHAITYKTEIFKQNGIVLDNCFYTDVEYVLFPIPYVKTVAYFDSSIYVYRVAQAQQSVSPESMMKNISQHNQVLERLLGYYKEKRDALDYEHKSYLAIRIAAMADVQLGTLLLFSPSKKQKKEIKSYINKIKSEPAEISHLFKKGKKYKFLVYFKYLFYTSIAKRYKQVALQRKSNN